MRRQMAIPQSGTFAPTGEGGIKTISDLEAHIYNKERYLGSLNENMQMLKVNKWATKEKIHALHLAAPFFGQADAALASLEAHRTQQSTTQDSMRSKAADRTSGRTSGLSAGLLGGGGDSGVEMSPVGRDSKMEGGQSMHVLSNVVGVVSADKVDTFKRVLYRTTRGPVLPLQVARLGLCTAHS